MTVLAEYNRETALQMQVSYRFLSNKLGTIYNDIASKMKRVFE